MTEQRLPLPRYVERTPAVQPARAATPGERAALSEDDWLRDKPTPLACYDCGLRYGGPGWCDCHVPNDVWRLVSPTGDEGGILCITCIANRLTALGIDGVPLKVTSGPWDHSRAGAADPLRQAIEALVSALERTETNFVAALHGLPVRDMAEAMAENEAALTRARRVLDGDGQGGGS